ncbi:MAG: DNA repair protein RadC [Gammaproteobacteria bacterium]|nr:DNA repair protein RadC [Gammaproteobacteria bacterium]
MTSPFKTSQQPGQYTVKGHVTEAEIMEMAIKLVNKRLGKRRALTDPNEVRDYLSVKLAGLEHEVFSVIFMNNKHRILSFEVMFRGTIDGASVHPREVVKRSLELNAAAVVLVHNHPSGDAKPSRQDIQITGRLKDALGLIDVRVLDHFIVGGKDVVSLAEKGHL